MRWQRQTTIITRANSGSITNEKKCMDGQEKTYNVKCSLNINHPYNQQYLFKLTRKKIQN